MSEADCQAYAGEKIPTLEEALLFTRQNDWQVNVEIKDLGRRPGSEVIVERVVELVCSLGIQGQVLISSFNHGYLLRSKAAAPQLRTAALVLMPVPFAARHLRRIAAQAYHPRLGAISAARVRSLQEQGFAVNVWTVNAENDLLRMIDFGVDGVITDFPQRLHNLRSKTAA